MTKRLCSECSTEITGRRANAVTCSRYCAADRSKQRYSQWYRQNRDREIQRAKKWHAENPEKARAASAAYDARNRERNRAWSAAYYAQNPEKMRAAHAAWRERNIEKIREYARAKSASYRTAFAALRELNLI